MSQRIAYLIKSYSIPESMVVNTYQIGIHLVPIGGTHTWDVAISSSAAGALLSFQVIFTRTTSRTLPPSNLG
jgi:hypothetical protein